MGMDSRHQLLIGCQVESILETRLNLDKINHKKVVSFEDYELLGKWFLGQEWDNQGKTACPLIFIPCIELEEGLSRHSARWLSFPCRVVLLDGF